jgi:hypothetical protein
VPNRGWIRLIDAGTSITGVTRLDISVVGKKFWIRASYRCFLPTGLKRGGEFDALPTQWLRAVATGIARGMIAPVARQDSHLASAERKYPNGVLLTNALRGTRGPGASPRICFVEIDVAVPKQAMLTGKAPKSLADSYNQAIVADGFAFASGQIFSAEETSSSHPLRKREPV